MASDHDVMVFCDKIAKQMRLAYAEASPNAKAHIERNPWEGLSFERRFKWLKMAQVAMNMIGQEFTDNMVNILGPDKMKSIYDRAQMIADIDSEDD